MEPDKITFVVGPDREHGIGIREAFISGLDIADVITNVPKGMCRITKIFVNPTTGRLKIQYDNTPVK